MKVPARSSTGAKCISQKRDKDGQLTGYQVAVQWKHRKRYRWVPLEGSQLAALSEALQVRAEFEKELGKPRTEHHIIGTAQGVTLHSRATVDGQPAYVAYIEVGGEKLATSFSTAEHGEDGAREKALAWRRQKEVEHFGAAFS